MLQKCLKIQIYVAIITFLIVALLKQKLKPSNSNYQILQILSVTLINKLNINQLF